MQTITIMPDYGGAYGWHRSRDVPRSTGVGANFASVYGWSCDLPISPELENAFIDWEGEFESHELMDTDADPGNYFSGFDWKAFHVQGLELTIRLKAEVGDRATVIYEKPYEDHGRDENERTEVLAGGQLRPLPSRNELAVLEQAFTK